VGGAHGTRAQRLRRLEARERVAVVGQLERQLLRAGRRVHHQVHGGAEAAQQRRHRRRRRRHALEHKGDHRRVAAQHNLRRQLGISSRRRATQAQRQVRPVRAQEAHPQRDELRRLGSVAARVRRDRQRLPALQRQRTRLRVVRHAHCQLRRARLAVPGQQRRQGVARVIGVAHGGEKVFARHRLAVVALEVQVHALSEAVAAQHRLVEPHNLSALLIHRH
jgi:hypothetical protein